MKTQTKRKNSRRTKGEKPIRKPNERPEGVRPGKGVQGTRDRRSKKERKEKMNLGRGQTSDYAEREDRINTGRAKNG